MAETVYLTCIYFFSLFIKFLLVKVKSTSIFLLSNTPENVVATHAFARESILTIMDHMIPASANPATSYSIWISREEDLHDFVFHIPDLAWEMLEYAEEPLEILYPKRKYNPTSASDTQSHISVRLVKGEKLIHFVKKNGPLISFPLSVLDNQLSTVVDEEYDLRDKGNNYSVVKSMKLFEDGSFTFLR